jgi:parallel beta-helix repeat protein
VQTLSIEPDAQIYVEPGVVIMVAPEGKLNIRGGAWFWGQQQAIRFEPQQRGRIPRQYLVLDSKQAVSLQGVVFESGGIAVEILAGSPDLKGVQFRNSEYSALSISGSSSPTLSNCLVQGSNTSGVIVENHARPVFKGCKFADNDPFHIQSTSIYEIDATGNSWQPAASSASVLGRVRY